MTHSTAPLLAKRGLQGRGFVKRLKIPLKHNQSSSPCQLELSALLACMASTGDTRCTEACKELAANLKTCMGTAPKGKSFRSEGMNTNVSELWFPQGHKP